MDGGKQAAQHGSKKKTKTNISGSERWFIGHATFKESDQNVIEVPKER